MRKVEGNVAHFAFRVYALQGTAMTGVTEDDDTTLEIIIRLVALMAVAIAASFFLAGASWWFSLGTGINTSLGVLVWNTFHLPYATEKGYPSLGENLFLQFMVDWAFWFALLSAFYWLYQRRKQKAEKS